MSKPEKARVVIASTTSTQNSGLFDVLIPSYEKATKYAVKVEVVAVGTGKAMRMAKRGEADLLFVHDPFREEKFVREGYGVNRRVVMHNHFVILGPTADPARIKEVGRASEAFELISETASPFLSRGDDSGTNMKEMDLWEDCGVNPKGKGWYFESGSKMTETLLAADRKGAYTLSDVGTYINHASEIAIKVLYEGDPKLMNYYSVIAVNPDRFPRAKYREAMDFIAYVTSPQGQRVIAGYMKTGTRLFDPDSVPSVMEIQP
jgi:tungstate transport system substrate-binding protein